MPQPCPLTLTGEDCIPRYRGSTGQGGVGGRLCHWKNGEKGVAGGGPCRGKGPEAGRSLACRTEGPACRRVGKRERAMRGLVMQAKASRSGTCFHEHLRTSFFFFFNIFIGV